jgi:transposase
MRIGCDLHARQQTLAMLDTVSGEVVNRTLLLEGNEVRKFYSELPRPALVGIEAIGPMQWFLKLLDELGIECRVGDATKVRAAEPRKHKHSVQPVRGCSKSGMVRTVTVRLVRPPASFRRKGVRISHHGCAGINRRGGVDERAIR